MTTPFEAYIIFTALKRHFTPGSGYDFVKYNGKVNAKESNFEARKDKVFFMKLAKKPDVVGFIAANLSQNPKIWVNALAYSPEAEQVYDERQKRLQSMSYNVTNECWSVTDNFNELLYSHPGEHPQLLRDYMRGRVSLETMIALDDLTGFSKPWSKNMTDTIWEGVLHKMVATRPFTDYDKQAVREALIKKYTF